MINRIQEIFSVHQIQLEIAFIGSEIKQEGILAEKDYKAAIYFLN